MRRYLLDVFTDDEGDFDIVVAMATLALLWFMGVSGYNTFWLHKDVTYMDLGGGLAALVVALGGAYKLKRKPVPTVNDSH